MVAQPAVAAKLVGPYPFAVGDSFTFQHTSEDSVQKGATGTPTVTTDSFTEMTIIQAPVKYDYPPSKGTVTAYPYRTTATRTSSAGHFMLSVVEYRNFIGSAGAQHDVEYGYTETSDLVRPDKVDEKLETALVYGSPLILDELPEKTGAHWPEPIAETETVDNRYLTGTASSNILQSKLARQSTGAYTDSGMSYDVPYIIAQKANGTGTHDLGPADATEEYTYGLPTPGAEGDTIPVQVTFEGKTGHNSVPDWYPGKKAPANPLTISSKADLGLVKIPTGCGRYYGKTGRLLRETYTQLSTAAGYTFDRTDSYYIVPNVGRACYAELYTRTDYDNDKSGAVTSIETFKEVDVLMSETLK